MNEYRNPTALRIGQLGRLNGFDYRVVGRVVLGVTDDGATYYWNEFNLEDFAGQAVTLVYEETDAGPAWKLFELFEPGRPLSAAEAAGKQVGDLVQLDDQPLPVTLVDRSRVYHIEGRAPEGVEIGDLANYFNLERGDEMQVVSWTGDDVECYRGVNLPAATVQQAFRLPAAVGTAFGTASNQTFDTRASAAAPAPAPRLRGLLVAGLAVLLGLGGYALWRHRPPAAPRALPSRVGPLTVGASGTLAGARYTVEGQAPVDIARVDVQYRWTLYTLRDAENQPALLIHGLTGAASDWHLFRFLKPSPPLTPAQAAARTRGAKVSINGSALVVRDLFRAHFTLSSGAPTTGEAFGFYAREAADWAVVWWTADALECLAGRAVSEKELLAFLGR